MLFSSKANGCEQSSEENPSLQVHLPLRQNPFIEQLFLQDALKQNYSKFIGQLISPANLVSKNTCFLCPA